MKLIKAMVATALLAAAAAAPIMPASAEQGNNNGANAELQQFCTDLIASGDFPGLNRGECMSFNIVPEAGYKAHFCDLLRETDALEDWGYDSFAECVRDN